VTSLGALAPGSPVNLERPVRADGRLDGHLVQGHIDGTGTVISRQTAERGGPGGRPPGPAENWQVLRIQLAPSLQRYVVYKGSVAVDGVSLTVSAVGESWFEVSLIPETLARTTLGVLGPGDPVNIEVDVLAKYVERLLGGSR
jgi:riboflavin synthase